MQHSTLEYYLALKSIPGIGSKTAQKLIDYFGEVKAIFNASLDDFKDIKLNSKLANSIVNFDFDSLDNIIQWKDKLNHHIISLESPLYPSLLKQIHSPPTVLFASGNIELLHTPQIAIVGSRSPSVSGINNTQSFCDALTSQGITVTSGLASGIDGEAHRATLKAGGNTIAVCGTGLNRVYPAHHRELAHAIAEKGLLLSEYMPDDGHSPGNFPQRNRIIAGLSLGTLVIEAAEKSGTLITARHAMEEGREVFAIPGSIHNPLSKGCHKLIKQGAKLTESLEDIIEDLPHVKQVSISNIRHEQRAPLQDDDVAFLHHVGYEITPLDTIVTRSQLTVEAVTNKLLTLELQGWVVNSAGGYIRQ